MSTLLRTRPIKIELIRLRNRLSISIRVEKILSERLTILVNEYMSSLREAIEKRKLVYDKLISIYRRAGVELGVYGSSLPGYLKEISPKPKIYTGTENIMGVKTKTVILRYTEDPVGMPPSLEEFVRFSRDFLNDLIDLARLEHAIYELGKEISATKQRTNALKYIIIPRLRNTIKTLQLKFDEREREEKARLKRIKQILARRVVPWMS